MKKTFIFILLIVLLLGIAPIIGNKIVTYYVAQEIISVKKKGISLNFKGETPGYFYTSKQYEFVLTDVEAFSNYLTEYGAGLLPPYTEEFLKSIVFRLDMKYHNIPFLEPISIDIYPMYVSDKIMKKLHTSNNIFFKNFRQFISRQGILYHLDYDLLSENYKGHMKNVDYDERSFNGSNVILTLHNALFNGTGSFSAPKSLQVNIEKIMLKTSDKSKDMTVEINEFSSKSTKNVMKTAEDMFDKSKELFESSKEMYKKSDIPKYVDDVKKQSENTAQEMYDTSMKMQSMFFGFKDKLKGKETEVKAENATIDISSQEDENKSKNKSYFFFEKLNIKDESIDVNLTTLRYESTISGVDTLSYQRLQKLLLQLKTSPSLSLLNDLKVASIDLLSHGLELEVPEFSIENVHYEGMDLGGIELSSALRVKEDANLAAKMFFSPLFIVKNLDIKLHLKVSKKIYKKLIKELPIVLLSLVAVKQNKDEIIYDMSYIDGSLKVNGNSII